MARKIVIEFLGDSKDLQKAMGDAESKSSSLSGRLKKVGTAAAVGFGVLGAAAVVGGKYVLDHGAKLEQMAAKADTVFGSQIGSVEKWADKSAHAMGLTRMEATGLAANFADLLIPMGFSRKAAAGMSTDVVGLSGALSQWSGGTVSAAEASDVLAKAMLGERDGLKALGISISEADVKAELMRKGQDKLTGAALAQATAQATQTLIFAKSTDAQKAFADGGSPLLSSQAKISAAIGEVRDKVVMGLVPAVGMAADWMLNKGLPAAQAFGGWLRDNVPPIFDRIKSVVSTVMGALQGDVGGGLGKVQAIFADVTSIVTSLWDRFGGTIMDYARTTFGNVKQIIGGALDVVSGIFQTFAALLKGDWSGAWDGVKKILSGAWDVMKGIVDQALNVVQTLIRLGWGAVKGIVSGAWDGIKDVVSNGIGRVVDFVQAIPGKFSNALSSLRSTAAGIFGDAMDAGRDKVTAIGATIIGWIADIPGKLREKLSNFREAGAALIGGFVDGMKNAGGVIEGIAGNVWNAVRGLLNSAISKINAALNFKISLPGPDLSVSAGNIPYLARGTNNFRGGLAVVGEEGPELVNLPRGSRVTPNSESMGAMRGLGGGGAPIVVQLVVAGRVLEQILIQHTRDTGRPLQVSTLGPA